MSAELTVPTVSDPVSRFLDGLTRAKKDPPALDRSGARTIKGYYHPRDAKVLSRFYPKVGELLIRQIADCIPHPRLLEVAGIAEMVERFLENSFSRIQGLPIEIAANPLSILFWSEGRGVCRIKTEETELLHEPMEKTALRTGALRKINDLLNRHFGIQLVFGCSCCVITVRTVDVETLFGSDYYLKREGLGREFDSDVLTVSDRLFGGISVSDVPTEVLNASADFHGEEVRSYTRFADAARTSVRKNFVRPDFGEDTLVARAFLTAGPAEMVGFAC